MKLIRRNKWKFILVTIFGLFIIWINYKYISVSTAPFIINSSNKLSKNEYALFLGTPKYLPSGNINNYYKNRITTVFDLYSKKKVDKIIISADSLNKYNENEVELIKYDLIEKGVKESDLVYDKKGNRTWYSISNLSKEIQLDTIVLVSQKFHLERAIYIAHTKGINVIGVTAKGKMSNKLWFRELLARVKMQIDIFTATKS